MDSEYVSLREFARRKGVAPNSISKAIANGRIRRDKEGIHWPTQSEAFEQYRDPSKVRDESSIPPRGGLKPPKLRVEAGGSRSEPDEDEDEVPPGLENDDSYLEAKRRKEWALARHKELELAEAKGKVLQAHLVRAAVAQLAIDVREAVMAIPDRVASELAAEVAKVCPGLELDKAREIVHQVWKGESRRILERIGRSPGEL